VKLTQPIRISVVSYLNSKPFIYGLKDFKFSTPIEISEDIPSVCAEKLINKKVDIGLVPVAVLHFIEDYSIISNYCIGSNGKVGSVLLVSDVPLKEIENVLLDYQSRTSVLLVKILAKEYWKINPDWIDTSANYENQIQGKTAGLIIGDRALQIRDKYKFVYDLSEEWKVFTTRPFVFAVWASNHHLDSGFIDEFNLALENGLSKIDAIAINEQTENFSSHEIKEYLTKQIDYNFDYYKKEAMNIFLEKASIVKEYSELLQK